MVSGIDSSSALLSGNLNVLKKAIDTEEQLMGSILSGIGGGTNLQSTQNAQPSEQNTQAQPSKNLDILA